DVVGIARIDRDADARRDEDLLAADLERPARGAQQPRREPSDLVEELAHMRRARDEHGEFVPGEPARDRALVELGLDPARERLEARVARGVPERVVDVLEA